MNRQTIVELLNAHPFHPFRIHLTDGKSYKVAHPDFVAVGRDRVLVGVGDDADEAPVRFDHCALIHIVRLEEIGQAA